MFTVSIMHQVGTKMTILGEKVSGTMITLAEIEATIAAGPYAPEWNSLGQFNVPQWFKQAKFGIFIHWGPYSVPAFRNEWYARNMYNIEQPEYEHHIQTYGPQKDFGFKDFIPLFKGENFDADAWVQLFKQTGAKYIFPVAEHHDGFQMYASELSHYNAAEMGPKKDILGALEKAAAKEDLHFCTSSHRAEHWWFLGEGKTFDSDIKEPLVKGDLYWPAMPEPDFQDLFSVPYPNQEFLEDWLLRTCEIIKNYQPELLYFDWWIQHDSFKEVLKKMMAYYYNMGAKAGKEVGVCYKHDALAFGSGIPDVERGKFKDPKPFYWQTDTAIARNSWCYTTSLEYKDVSELVIDLVETVSKNGNLLLNVGPKADGTIPERDREIMLTIGDWLATNGEGIYESKMWRISGEGPTEIVEGQFQDQTKLEYTSADIRYTSRGDSVYAYVLGTVTAEAVVLPALSLSEDQNNLMFHGIVEEVTLMGHGPIEYTQDHEGLKALVPAALQNNELPLGFKVRMK